jgi:hypothetical protein
MQSIDFPEEDLRQVKRILNNIKQIEYSIKRTGSENGLLTIEAFNNLRGKSNENPSDWRFVPVLYYAGLRRAFFRLELLKLAAAYPHKDKDYTTASLRYLIHLDSVLDGLWKDALEATANGSMHPDWRSSCFDHWLVVECNVQRYYYLLTLKGFPLLILI